MAKEYKEIKLYNEEVLIKFDEENHAYWLAEDKMKRLSGSTTFLSVIDKPALIPWAVGVTVEYVRQHLDELQSDPKELLRLAKEEASKQKDLAAEIGKAIHKWIEQHINGDNPEMPDDDNVLNGVVNFLNWVKENGVGFVTSEKVVYSRNYGYVGTLDIKIRINGKLYLIDIKTGNALYAEVKAQTASYLKADEEESGDKYEGRWAIRISKETEAEYKARMEAKGKTDYPPFKIVEALYLDADKEALDRDFKGFLSAMELYRWKQAADKEMNSLKS